MCCRSVLGEVGPACVGDGPPAGFLLAGELTGPHPLDLLAVLELDQRVGGQVVVPARMTGRSAGRGDDGVGAVLFDPDQWGLADLAGLGTLGGEDDDGFAFEGAAFLAVGGLVEGDQLADTVTGAGLVL